jgi:hypothetical protein
MSWSRAGLSALGRGRDGQVLCEHGRPGEDLERRVRPSASGTSSCLIGTTAESVTFGTNMSRHCITNWPRNALAYSPTIAPLLCTRNIVAVLSLKSPAVAIPIKMGMNTCQMSGMVGCASGSAVTSRVIDSTVHQKVKDQFS